MVVVDVAAVLFDVVAVALVDFVAVVLVGVVKMYSDNLI